MNSFQVKFLRILFILSLIGLPVSCGQDYNSNSFDNLGDATCPSPGDPDFCKAYDVLTKKCIRCHTGQHATWASYTSLNDFVSANLVDATGNIDNSPLIKRLSLYSPQGNMPLAPYVLQPSEYDILVNWVESL